jgi:hypothetical protein
VDETELGDDFAHVMSEVSEPRQEVDFSKEDGTVQATYFLSSVAALGDGTEAAPASSYYTTGSGLVLDTVLPPLNGTTSPLTLNMSILLEESGFVGSVRDWVEEYFPYFVAAAALGVSALLVAWHLRMRRRRVESQKSTEKEDEIG